MSLVVVTYIGFFVAALILTWGLVELSRRFYRWKKIDKKTINSWVPLNPISANAMEDPTLDSDEQDEDPRLDIRTRAKQNGHYSPSNKTL
jgi:hypothetical protein